MSLILFLALAFYMGEWIISTAKLVVAPLLYPLSILAFIDFMHPAYVIFVNRKDLKVVLHCFFVLALMGT